MSGEALLTAAPSRIWHRGNKYEALLKAGADKEARDTKFGATALIHAAKMVEALCIEMLLRWGADTVARDDGGQTALDHAQTSFRAARGRCVKLLKNPPLVTELSAAVSVPTEPGPPGLARQGSSALAFKNVG